MKKYKKKHSALITALTVLLVIGTAVKIGFFVRKKICCVEDLEN